MKQKFIIFIVFALMATALIGLNAASYTQKEKAPDSEIEPNRSSFNSGPTGTQAFYSLLAETGRNVVRWQEPADALATKRTNVPSTFVVVGSLRRKFDEPEITGLLRWVSAGGRLVMIDRDPPADLVTTTANWKLIVDPQNELNLPDADASDTTKMTAGTPAAKPAQPSTFTTQVNAIQTSQFASSIKFEPISGGQGTGIGSSGPPPPPRAAPRTMDLVSAQSANKKTDDPALGSDNTSDDPPPTVKIERNGKFVTLPTPTPVSMDEFQLKTADEEEVESPGLSAPVVHAAVNGKNVLVDVPFGNGRIVFLSDPYIVANGGIALVDNARLAVNLVAGGDGPIAFDEYHQGYGANNNRLLEFFAGTPVVAIFFQCLLLVGLIFFSQSRRFARALPEAEPDRLSKLEYVAAMAELQQRTKAYDLAIENIYKDFRRRASRLLGVDNHAVSGAEFAARLSERTNIDRDDIEDLLFKCDEIVVGEPTSKREVVNLVGRIREAEYRLGLRKRTDK